MEAEREEITSPLPVAEEPVEGTSSGSEDLELEPVVPENISGDFVPGKRRKMPEKVTKKTKKSSKKATKKGKKAKKAGTAKIKSIKKSLQGIVKRCGNV
jgi:hypothetical protein